MPTRCSSRSAARRTTSRRPAITCANSATRKVGSHPHQRHPPVPRGGRHQRAARQEERHHPRAHRRRHGRRQSAGPRHPRGAGQGATKRRKFGGALPALTPGGDAAPVPRRLRHRLARFPPRAHARRLRVRHRPDPAQGRQERGRRRDLFRARASIIPTPSSARTRRRCCRTSAIAVRFHSIGGWGMITTGKNLGEIIGDFGKLISEQRRRRTTRTASSRRSSSSWPIRNTARRRRARRPIITSPSRRSSIKVNCELNHVDVVLCCDPEGLHAHQPARRHQARAAASSGNRANRPRRPGSASRRSTASSSGTTTSASSSCPASTSRARRPTQTELQLRMQGNSFLGAFFRVSPFLQAHGITEEKFHDDGAEAVSEEVRPLRRRGGRRRT